MHQSSRNKGMFIKYLPTKTNLCSKTNELKGTTVEPQPQWTGGNGENGKCSRRERTGENGLETREREGRNVLERFEREKTQQANVWVCWCWLKDPGTVRFWK